MEYVVFFMVVILVIVFLKNFSNCFFENEETSRPN